MLQKKYFNIVLSAFMAILMGLVMSGFITAVNTGIDVNYLYRWMKSFAVAAPAAFICMQFLRPLATRLATAVTMDE